MEERNSILSLIYYENELVYSLNCYFVENEDDLIEITLSQDSIVKGSVKMNSLQLKSIISFLDNIEGDSIDIDDVIIKKDFLKNLETICE